MRRLLSAVCSASEHKRQAEGPDRLSSAVCKWADGRWHASTRQVSEPAVPVHVASNVGLRVMVISGPLVSYQLLSLIRQGGGAPRAPLPAAFRTAAPQVPARDLAPLERRSPRLFAASTKQPVLRYRPTPISSIPAVSLARPSLSAEPAAALPTST